MAGQRRAHHRRAHHLVIALLALLALLVGAPAAAQTTQHVGVYFDVDDDTATGCDAQGFSGAELRLTVTLSVVNTPSPAAQVTAAEVEQCADPGTDSFGAPQPVSGHGTPPWPVGVGLGLDGSDVIEAYVSRTVFPDAAALIRAGVVSGQGEPPADTMYVTLGGGSDPILIPLGQLIPIPTLSEWMLLALALLLATSALLVLRRRPARMAFVVAFLVLALSAGGAGVAWAACVMDGMVGDWAGESPLAQDPTSDASGSNPDLRAFFAKEDGDVVCLRIDAFVAFNGAPVANDDGYVTDEETPLNVAAPGVLVNDSDPDSDPLSVTGFDATSAQGAAVTVNADGSFTYDPTGSAALQALPAGDSVDDTFTYTVSDGNGASDSATVTVTVSGVNDAPTAMADNYETDEDTSLVIPAPGVLVNDSDVDTGDTLSAVLDTDVSDGTLTLNPDGSFTYDPDLNFNGTDSFTYHANDGAADSATVTVTLTVGPVNDGPNAVDDNFATDEDTPLNIGAPGVLTNDTDPENDALTVVSHDATSAQGAAVTVNADGSFTYDPTGAAALQALAAGATVNDTFTYTIEDPSGINPDTATVTVEVTGVDDPPTAVNDAATVTEDDPATTIDVQANDTDPEGDTNTIAGVTQPTNGTVVITNAGADLTYEPAANYCNDGVTTDDFTYTLSPGGSVATVAVTVTCVNDDPVADAETLAAACNLEQVVEANAGETAAPTAPVFRTVTDNVLIGDSDPVEGTAIQIIQASGAPGGTSDATAPFEITTNQGGSLTLHADGSFVYTPEGGDRGLADTFTYTIQDADGGTATATVTLNVASTCIWFVDNSVSALDDVGTGTSSDPFTSLVDEIGPDANPDDAEDASQAGDVIYVFEGDSTSGDSYLGGFVAQANERLLGQGVDLVVDLGSGPETLFTGNPANQPLVENQAGAGDAVQVTDVTGVEVAGFQLAAAGNALQVTAAASPAGVDFHDNEISGAAAEAILISQTVNNASDVRLADNTVSATGNGIDASLTAGSLALVIDGNTGITSDGNGIDLDGTGGDLYVTSFCGNTVSGDTVGSGILADAVIFDASPLPGGDLDFTGDEVGCGTATSVGSGANPVGGHAMVLNNVSGDLAFGDLDLFTDGTDAGALVVTGTGLLNAAAGTGFELTSTSGTLSSADGPAVDVDPTTIGLVFDAVTSAGSSTFGISLTQVAGSFQVTGATSVSNAGGDGIAVVDSTVAVTLGGQVTVNGTGSEGIFLDDLIGNFSAPSTTSSITGTTGDAFSSQSSEGNVTYNGTITNTSANSVDIRNHGGAAATTLTFAGNIDDDGAGIFLDSNNQGAGSTVNFTGGLDLDTGTNTAFNATNGGIVNVTSGGVSTTADTTTGTLVNIANTTIGASGVTFDSTGKTGGANGILLTNAGGGAFVSDAGSIANQTSRGVDVAGGSGNVTIDNSLSTTAAGRSVEVTGHSGGTVDFNGAITDTGLGVHLDSNTGAILRFDGGLAIDIAGTEEGFNATGGGTVHVTGINTVDTADGIGTAVNILDTTLGSDGVTFRSVQTTSASSNPGIVLDDTGLGNFEVTGTGAAGTGGTISNKTADAVTLFDTDGLVTLNDMIIQDIGNMAAVDSEHDGIHGADVDGGLVLDNVTIRRISDMAVHGAGFPNGDTDTVWNGLTITNSTIEDANRYHVAGQGDTSDEGGVRIRGLRGTVNITGNTFQDTGEHLDLFATAGTLNLTATGNSFFETYKEFSSGAIASVGKMCLDLTVQGAAAATVDVSGNNAFRNCRIASVRVANDSAATGTITTTVANNTFLVTDHSSGIGGDFDFPMGGVKYSTRGAAAAVFNGRISGNTFTDVTNADGGVGNVTLDMDQGVIQVLVDGNTFHAPGNAAWYALADGTSSFDLEFDNNTYQRDAFPCTTDPSCGGGYFGPGLYNRTVVQNGGVLDVTYRDEDFAQHDTGFDPGNTVEVQVINVGGGGTACAFFTSNSSPHGYALEESAGDLNLYNGLSALTGTCSGGAPANCVTVLDANSNTGGGGNAAADPPTVSVFGTIDIVSSACSLPSGGIF